MTDFENLEEGRQYRFKHIGNTFVCTLVEKDVDDDDYLSLRLRIDEIQHRGLLTEGLKEGDTFSVGCSLDATQYAPWDELSEYVPVASPEI